MRIRWGIVPTGVFLVGCSPDPAMQERYENARLKESVDDLQRTVDNQKLEIDELKRQLQTARGISDVDLRRLVIPVRIDIDPLTGGDNYDKQPGDDGVTVYLRPVDKDGDTIKVSGDVTIELFDLQRSDQPKLGTFVFTPEQVSSAWHGKLMTQHFTLKCPWQTGPPAHADITVRATFVEHLSRSALTAQAVCKVRVDSRQAASQPGRP